MDKAVPWFSDRIAVGDFNRDGIPDFVTTDQEARIAVGLGTGKSP